MFAIRSAMVERITNVTGIYYDRWNSIKIIFCFVRFARRFL